MNQPHNRSWKFILITGITLLIGFILSFEFTSLGFAQTGPDTDTLTLGATLYAENCAVCHGDNGEGRAGATLSKNWPSIRPDLAIRETIRRGVAGSPMPAWSSEFGGPLNEDEIDAIVQYILNWQTGGSEAILIITPTIIPVTIQPVPNVSGNPSNGALLYNQNCKVCHGENGEGRIGAVLNKTFSSIRPDLSIKDTISRGVQGSPMPAWSKEFGGPLNDADINDIVAYILTWEGGESPISNTPQSPPVPERQLSWLSGWWGIIITIVAFLTIVTFAVFVQNRNK